MRTPSFDVKILVEKVRLYLGIYGTLHTRVTIAVRVFLGE